MAARRYRIPFIVDEDGNRSFGNEIAQIKADKDESIMIYVTPNQSEAIAYVFAKLRDAVGLIAEDSKERDNTKPNPPYNLLQLDELKPKADNSETPLEP